MGTPIHLTNPELLAKLEQWTTQTGRPAEELIEVVMAGYFDELAEVRQTLDTRYDDSQKRQGQAHPGRRSLCTP